MTQALKQRWSGFIAKIHGRLDDIMRESEQGMQGLFAQHPDDFLPVINAMSGLDARIRVLENKLQDTWDELVEAKFSSAGIVDTGLDMKSDARHALEWKWAAWKARIAADFYRRLEPTAKAAAAEPVHCTQCATPIPRTSKVAMAAITCPACGAVSQVAPSKEMSTYYGGMPGAFADEQTVGLREQIDAFREQCDRWRRDRSWAPEPLQNYERWEEMERHYWVTRTKIACELAGKAFDQELIDARMRQFIKYSLECEQVWVKAKGRIAGS